MSMFDKLKTGIHQTFVKTAANLMPALKDSKFLEEGILTPEEFVAAGDLLVYKCPTWTWQPAESGRGVSMLPEDKQFLITKNVPCVMRLKEMEEAANSGNATVVADDDGEWLAPAFKAGASTTSAAAAADCSTPSGEGTSSTPNLNDDDSEDIPDMEDFDDDEDPAALTTNQSPSDAQKTDNILRTRTYDISVSYDRYYQTPKVWLVGYDENKQPLKPQQMFEDISSDHAQKTVTVDTHPHMSVSCAFIHPCKHASVMKSIVHRHIESGKEPRVDQYLFLFLKFISVVIPSIEYDYTVEIEA